MPREIQHPRFWTLFCILLCGLCVAQGCARLVNSTHRATSQGATTQQSIDGQSSDSRGLVLLLNGIEGPHIVHNATLQGLRSGGVQRELELYDWTTGLAPLMLVHLRSSTWHDRAAHRLAQRIEDHNEQFPDAPIGIVAHSGGTAIALEALKLLPPEVQVDEVILLASALSPAYDYEPALKHIRRGIWNFQSSIADSPLLGAGTAIFGTMDGKHDVGAGLAGFHKSPSQPFNSNLHEVSYELSMLQHANFGGHYGSLSYFAAKNQLAPILTEAPTPNR